MKSYEIRFEHLIEGRPIAKVYNSLREYVGYVIPFNDGWAASPPASDAFQFPTRQEAIDFLLRK